MLNYQDFTPVSSLAELDQLEERYPFPGKTLLGADVIWLFRRNRTHELTLIVEIGGVVRYQETEIKHLPFPLFAMQEV